MSRRHSRSRKKRAVRFAWLALPLLPILFLLLLDWGRVRAHVDAYVEMKSRKPTPPVLVADSAQNHRRTIDISQGLPPVPAANLDENGFVETNRPGDALTGSIGPRGAGTTKPSGASSPARGGVDGAGETTPPTLVAALPGGMPPSAGPQTLENPRRPKDAKDPKDPKDPQEEPEGNPPTDPSNPRPKPEENPGPDPSPPPDPPLNPPVLPPNPPTKPPVNPPFSPPGPDGAPPPKEPLTLPKEAPPLGPADDNGPGALTPPGVGSNPPSTAPDGKVNNVQEPTTLLLMFGGFAGVLLLRRHIRI